MSGTEKDDARDDPGRPRSRPPQAALRAAVLDGDADALRRALRDGADINGLDGVTGLAPLHLAVGLNDLALTRLIAEEAGASFFPDRFGRWPSLVAAENRVDAELSDYIVEREAAWLKAHPDEAS